MRLRFRLWASLEVTLALAGQAFHFCCEFAGAQGQADVRCLADF
jgi:hypothetical protein